ncbi:MAG TPA: alpha-amylase family glycosyl hydrolase [Saprospiraceae bacterium]|nr:alpha-amylase family glycosyl hydrolase [Saprospiraceae bacterium]
MKKLFLLPILLASLHLVAQVTCDPVFPTQSGTVTIFYNATQGNAALTGVSPVYAHMGVITSASTSLTDWQHVPTTWGIADPVGTMQNVAPNIWKKTIVINDFFNIQPGETVLKLAFVFRNQSGSIVGRAADGSDIYYNVYPDNAPLQTVFLQPGVASMVVSEGAQIPVQAAASKIGMLTLYDNGTQITTLEDDLLETTLTASGVGLHTIRFVAATATEQDTAVFTYVIPADLPAQDPPAGSEWGINYVDDTTVRLVLYAPEKQVVFAVGDFSNWLPDPTYQMRQSLDGNTWWLELGGLTAGQIVRYQYLVDGSLKIADPLSTLILDPNNDPYIPEVTYPDLPAYPTGFTTGIVSVLQTAQAPFNWQATDYVRPAKNELVVYELLMRDFLARHDYQTLLDTLDYLQNLGITAIELMPVNEFDGNINWGYGPSFHKALDKYYGTAEAFKTVIDACHQRGIAVILDAVFNQATGASPLAQLYWDATNNRPAANNPWLNPTATHDFNVFNDFNHESQATKTYMKNCVKYWLQEFHIDGFRFDLSKGFTQKNTLGNVGAWGAYDATRIAIWKNYADFIWSIDPETYVILEHFADNSEEKVLAEYGQGMMLWGNMWGAYKEVALAYSAGVGTSLAGVSYVQRGWSVPHLVGYMESHDEQRIAYECKVNGSTTANYNVKSLPTGMRRLELVSNLLYTVPGPKMLWQFGEMGYDFPINYCENGSVSEGCRTSPKPIRWDYLDDPYRRRLHDVVAALLNLRKNHDVFETTDFQLSLGGGSLRTIRLNGSDLDVFVVANVSGSGLATTVTFPNSGQWFEYYTGDTLTVPAGSALSLSFGRGEYRLYLDQHIDLPEGLNPTPTREVAGLLSDVVVWPNPATDDIVRMNFTLEESSDVRLEISDVNGKRIDSQLFDNLPGGEQTLEITDHHWEPGVYFLTLRDRNGAGLARKLVKL